MTVERSLRDRAAAARRARRGRAAGAARRVARDPAGRGDGAARARTAPASRTLVLAVAGGLRADVRHGSLLGDRRPHQAPAGADPPRRRRRRPRGAAAAARAVGRRQPARGHVRPRAGRGRARHGVRARAVPRAQAALATPRRGRCRAASSRWSCWPRRWCRSPSVILVDELSLGLAPLVVKRLVPDPRLGRRVGRRGAAHRAVRPRRPRAGAARPTSSRAAASATSGTARELQDDPELLHSAYLLARVGRRWSSSPARSPSSRAARRASGWRWPSGFAAEGMRIVLADIERPVLAARRRRARRRRASTCSPCRPT